jgi:hypothetical protein
MRRSLFAAGGGSTSSGFLDDSADDNNDEEELPFAVDNDTTLLGAAATGCSLSSSSSPQDVSASAILFAQKLGKHSARPMFASTSILSSGGGAALPVNGGGVDAVDRLADQLAEFRSFGASLDLVLEAGVGGGGAAAAAATAGEAMDPGGSSSTTTTNNSTPISLRT